MKKALIFVGLKITEVIGVVVVYSLLCIVGQGVQRLLGFSDRDPFWACGFFMCLVIAVLIVVIFMAYLIIKANWGWTKKIEKKWRH